MAFRPMRIMDSQWWENIFSQLRGTNMGEADVVSVWSLRIAEEAAPYEVDIAPDMTYAFIAGGKDREELLRQSEGVPGAFGPDIAIALFPVILSAIEAAGPHLLHFLSTVVNQSQDISAFATVLNSLVSVGSHFKRRKQAESLPDDRYAPLKKVSDDLTEELSKAGLDQDRADLITYRVLKVMIEDPSGAGQFTKAVTQVP
jgi:hypothetical protein